MSVIAVIQTAARSPRLSLSSGFCHQRLEWSATNNWMDGHTQDLSSNGLAVVVPRITLGEHHLVGENRGLNLKLQLPGGPVEMLERRFAMNGLMKIRAKRDT